jgi:hypothetical protein
MQADTPFGNEDDPDEWLRPAWEDTPDETDADRRPRPDTPPGAGARTSLAADPLLLATLAEASDALARADARRRGGARGYARRPAGAEGCLDLRQLGCDPQFGCRVGIMRWIMGRQRSWTKQPHC